MSETKKKTAPKFTKEQVMNAKKPLGNLDVLYVVLEDEKSYTKAEIQKLHDDFLKKEVK